MAAGNCEGILREIGEGYQDALSANLVGVYVHGSIAFGCFRWESSDVDYIVVVDRPLSPDEKRAVMEKTISINRQAPAKGLEMSVVLREHCLHFTYPTPYELHFSKMYLERYERSPRDYCKTMSGVDKDLAAHFKVIRHKGIVMWGEPISAVFGPVEPVCFLDSIRADIEHAEKDVLDNPVYAILNLCRVAAYVEEELILSKPEGGRWALLHTLGRYRELIEAAGASLRVLQ